MIIFLSACFQQSRLEPESDRDGDGYTEIQGDCNDLNASIAPNVAELCDYLDNNCDGLIDEDLAVTTSFFRDQDGDGYGGAEGEFFQCTPPDGWSFLSGDCDDSNPSIHPDAQGLWSNATTDFDCNGLREPYVRESEPTWDIQLDGMTSLEKGWNNSWRRPLLIGYQRSEVFTLPYPRVVQSFVNVFPYTVQQILPTDDGRLSISIKADSGHEDILFFDGHRDVDENFGASGGIELKEAQLLSWASLGNFWGSGNVLAFSILDHNAQSPDLILIEEDDVYGQFLTVDDLFNMGELFDLEHFSGTIWSLGDRDGDGFTEIAVGKNGAVVLEIYSGGLGGHFIHPRWSLQAETGCDISLSHSPLGTDLLCSSLSGAEQLLFENIGTGLGADLLNATLIPVSPFEIQRISEDNFAWINEDEGIYFSTFADDVQVGYALLQQKGMLLGDWFGQDREEILSYGPSGVHLLELPLD